VSATVPVGSALSEGPPIFSYRIVRDYPHDPAAFTQGLVYDGGVLYEGTGLWGQSTLRKVDLETGEILQSHALLAQYFGEGITIWEDKIIQLTWKAGAGFVYDRNSFDLLDIFAYGTEGWGITHDGTNLIMSDGTATLHFWDPETFQEIKRVQVHDERGPVVRLNELEYIQGRVYANVWQTDWIAIIEPETGQVTGWVDLRGLLQGEDLEQAVDVLNGIAYDADGDRLFVTGKWWPKLFEIALIPAP
jgi:glutamine cyclotransferase